MALSTSCSADHNQNPSCDDLQKIAHLQIEESITIYRVPTVDGISTQGFVTRCGPSKIYLIVGREISSLEITESGNRSITARATLFNLGRFGYINIDYITPKSNSPPPAEPRSM